MEFILVEKSIFIKGSEFGDGFKDEKPALGVFLSNYYKVNTVKKNRNK
ncbi:MAG: hypothetical protein L3J25_06460 [Flavobacteriaceae bacterium]|nr:hypothetical protein [Flavobacteriaceae bacterium]